MSKPDPIHDGLTWRDMPGGNSTSKRCAFALFKRGQITKEYVLAGARGRRRMNYATIFHAKAKQLQRAEEEAALEP